jgi:hypothetical protein
LSPGDYLSVGLGVVRSEAGESLRPGLAQLIVDRPLMTLKKSDALVHAAHWRLRVIHLHRLAELRVVIPVGVESYRPIEELLERPVHLPVVLARSHVVVVLPVPYLLQVLLDLALLADRLAHLLDQLVFVYDLGILRFLKERDRLGLDLHGLAEVLLVESVIFLIILAVGHVETVVPGFAMQLIEFSCFLH